MRLICVRSGLLLTLVLLTTLAGQVTSAAPVPKTKPKTTADKLIGTWKLTLSPGLEDGTQATVEFTKDGKLTLQVQLSEDSTITLNGTYSADGDKIPYEIESDDGKRKETLTIKKLTDDLLITVDPEGKVEEFKRVK